MIWYFASANGEVSPRISDNLCVSTDGSDVSIEECSVSSLSRRIWGSVTLVVGRIHASQLERTLDPYQGCLFTLMMPMRPTAIGVLELTCHRRPQRSGSLPVSTPPMSTRLHFERAWSRKRTLNGASTVILPSVLHITHRLRMVSVFWTATLLAVRWNVGISRIRRSLPSPEQTDVSCGNAALMIVTMHESRRCPWVTAPHTDSREWKIVSANQYTCGSLGTSSFGDTSAAGLGNGCSRTMVGILALLSWHSSASFSCRL